MSLSHEIMGGGGRGLITTVSASFLLGGTAVKAFTKIEEGQMGVRTHFGKATRTSGDKEGELYGIVGPGIRVVVPFTHAIKNISIQDRTNTLPEIQINSEGEQLRIESYIRWAVRKDGDNPYKALFKVEDSTELTQTVSTMCMAGLLRVMDGMNKREIKQHNIIDQNVKDACGEDLLNYGVVLRRINATTVTPTLGEMIKQSGSNVDTSILGGLAAHNLGIDN